MIYLLKFIPFGERIFEEITIPSGEAVEFIRFGTAVIWILIFYNGLYLIEFIWENIIK